MPSKNIDEYVKMKLEMEKKKLTEGEWLDGLPTPITPLSEKYQNAAHKAWMEKKGQFDTHQPPVSSNEQTLSELKAFKEAVKKLQQVSIPPVGIKASQPKEVGMFSVTVLAREFYTVEALRFLYIEYDATPEQVEVLENYRDRLHTAMAYLFRDYIAVSCFGEARHGGSTATYYIPELVTKHRLLRYRTDAGELAKQYSLDSIRKRTYELFMEGNWQSSFGGERWAKAIKALDMFSRPAVFIDHVFDLKHNGSSLFNKSDYGLVTIEDTTALKYYLNKRFATSEVGLHELVNEYLKYTPSEELVPLIQVVHPTKMTPKYRMQTLFDYKPIEFGSKELSEPIERTDTPATCNACGYMFFRIAHYEHYCSECLADDSLTRDHHGAGGCAACQNAYEIHYGKPKKPKTQDKKEKATNEKRLKTSTGKQNSSKAESVAKSPDTGGKSSGNNVKSKPKFDIGSKDYTTILTLKTNSKLP